MTLSQVDRDTDPRPPVGMCMTIVEDGRTRLSRVQDYARGSHRDVFPVRDELPPYQWHHLTIGDPRIVEPVEYGP